jgi:Leucine-rich repeat (LRR) protein
MPSRLTVVLVSLLLALPVVIFWLWLVIVPATVAILCPEGCRCHREGYRVICHESSLKDINLIHLRVFREILLFDYNITLLKKDSFVILPELEGLGLEWCGIRTIELGAFNGLTALTELSIGNNEISEIIPGTFQNIISLVVLNLEGNRIEHLDRNMFSGLFKLEYIDLSQNKLQFLHPDTFSGLPKLELLYLNNNPGLRIPTDSKFLNSYSLAGLDISRCNVSSVSVETFANVSALKWLLLSNNILWTVDINILTALPKLSTLYLYGNRLQCDCQLKEVWRWCKDRNIRTGDVICETPSEVEGMWWRGVREWAVLSG